MSLIVMTPTGNRNKVFGLCQKWVARQTLKPDQWIVIDDGEEKYDLPNVTYLDYVKRKRLPSDPRHTLTLNTLMGFERIPQGDHKIIVVEDDDWYHPEYLEIISILLNKYQLAGQGEAFYYFFPAKQVIQHHNKNHCSWCQTGFQSNILPLIKKVCRENFTALDIRVWQLKVTKIIISGYPPLLVGMKGLPGRTGQTSGWNPTPRWTTDNHYEWLDKIIGKDRLEFERICDV